MSDEALPDVGTTDEQSEVPLEPIENRDFVLCMLSDFANRFGFRMGITLHTHGFLVTGVLISKDEFFEGIASFVKQGLGADAEETFFDNLAAASRKNSEAKSEDETKDFTAATHFLHLKDVQIMHPSQPAAPSNPTVWRMRISEISGFTIGQFRSVPA